MLNFIARRKKRGPYGKRYLKFVFSSLGQFKEIT
jgi:hypothetical protein